MAKKERLIVAIGDLHFPFHDKEVLRWILEEVIGGYGNRIFAVCQVGDLADQWSWTKFPKRLGILPTDEAKEARLASEELWRIIKRKCPRAKKFQLLGNHDVRMRKRVIERMNEIEYFISDQEYYRFDGVQTIDDTHQELEIDDWLFFHGWKTKIGDHLQEVDFQNVCVGHSHRGGTHFRRVGKKSGKIVTELNAGYVGNPFHEALCFRPLKKYFTWTHGVGLIDSNGGRFIPFTRKKKPKV